MTRDLIKSKPWLPYVLPMGVYMGFLLVQSNANLLWLYPLKTMTVAAVLWWFRKDYLELKPKSAPLAALIGLVAIGLWIGLDPYYPKIGELLYSFEMWLSRLLHSPPPTAKITPPFDPTTIHPLTFRYDFLIYRVVGAVMVVPIMEELFWRGFLIRWIENEDFQAVPIGLFTWRSFAVTTLFFGLEHDQWLVGLICGAFYNWLLYRTRSVWACIIAHAVSNGVLAAWVLSRGDWRFW